MTAYRELANERLFREQWVRVAPDPSELPGYRGDRFLCPHCGEGVNFGRFEEVNSERLCLTCAHPELRYWAAE